MISLRQHELKFLYSDFSLCKAGVIENELQRQKTGCPTRSDSNRAVQAQTMTSDWKFWI